MDDPAGDIGKNIRARRRALSLSLEALARRSGVSPTMLSEVERICDRVVIVNEGRVAAEGAIDELTRPGETLEDAFVRAVRG